MSSVWAPFWSDRAKRWEMAREGSGVMAVEETETASPSTKMAEEVAAAVEVAAPGKGPAPRPPGRRRNAGEIWHTRIPDLTGRQSKSTIPHNLENESQDWKIG